MSKTLTARQLFARNLRKARIGLGLSQELLAEKAGLHRTYIGSVERSERNISVDNMEQLARSVKKSLVELLGE